LPAIFHACHLVQPSNRGEYEIPEAIDLLIQSGRTIDAIGMNLVGLQSFVYEILLGVAVIITVAMSMSRCKIDIVN